MPRGLSLAPAPPGSRLSEPPFCASTGRLRAPLKALLTIYSPFGRSTVTRRTANGLVERWAQVGSNHRPPACEAGALPLSYAPESESRIPNDIRRDFPRRFRTIRGRAPTYELPSLGEGRLLTNVPVPGTGTKRMTKRHATQRSPSGCRIPGDVPVPGPGTQLYERVSATANERFDATAGSAGGGRYGLESKRPRKVIMARAASRTLRGKPRHVGGMLSAAASRP
jgi:hypothetical protein